MAGRNRRNWTRARWIGLLLLLVGPAAGCQVEEALIDGVYGGISDTVATVISNALLAQLDDI